MEPQAPPPPPPPQAPQPQPQKKKMGALGWVLIGCGGIVVLGTILAVAAGMFVFNKGKDLVEKVKEDPVRTAAEMAVKLNPDLELVESNDAEGTITIRDKRTGEEGTFDWSEVQEGRFSFESSDGESMTIDARGAGGDGVIRMQDAEGKESAVFGGGSDLPDWFPAYPGASKAGSTFSSESNGGKTEMFSFTAGDTVTELMGWYEEELGDLGFDLSRTTYSQDGVDGGSLSGRTEDGKRSISVAFSETDDGTQVGVNYSERP